MTTAVASPPSFQSLPRIGWNSSNGGAGGLNSMSAEEVSRLFMPQRKSVQRTNSASSIASSSSSNSSTSTVSAAQPSSHTSVNGESGAAKKKPKGGFWPSSKAEPVLGVTNARAQPSTPVSGPAGVAAMSAVHQASPVVLSQHSAQSPSQQNGLQATSVPSSNEPPAVLALLPMNGTFERKQISLPSAPDVLRIGRQTNAKTVPTPLNGFFDSKVLSRQHAEVWSDRAGKVWIRDVKSSNGTFVNGSRLSPENRESEAHELHEQDTLELGIDIVSEDQKTIVHHKVSAKVEFAGVPGGPGTGNVLDLNFGDMDPSQNGGLLSSPLSQPVIHLRGRAGGPLTNGRLSTASSVVGSQVNSLAQQRQMNLWNIPLNVEQLVKTVSTEMKAARQQSQDLEQAGTYLNSLISSENRDGIPHPSPTDNGSSRLINGRHKVPKLDPISRFSEPPAPPPQQPLPEKPDTLSTPLETSSHILKHSEAARPGLGTSSSPTTPQSSQILSLVEALSSAKKELDTQGARMKHLEDMLRQERSARESAEDRARRLEQHASFTPTNHFKEETEISNVEESSGSSEPKPWPIVNGTRSLPAPTPASSEHDLQQRLDLMVAEMDKMKTEMEKFQRRADSAETEAAATRISLSEMITRFRAENAIAAAKAEKEIDSQILASAVEEITRDGTGGFTASSTALSKPTPRNPNGHLRTPPRLPEHLERAVAALLKDRNGDGPLLAQSAPFASMLGVVLIGVGLMAYLNSWQKTEK